MPLQAADNSVELPKKHKCTLSFYTKTDIRKSGDSVAEADHMKNRLSKKGVHA